MSGKARSTGHWHKKFLAGIHLRIEIQASPRLEVIQLNKIHI